MSDYDNLANSGIMRTIEDYAMGINFSRVMSVCINCVITHQHRNLQTILQNKSYTHLANTQYTDDSKVTDHYAIIPTGQLTELGTLSPLQQKVYELIVRRFLSIFYPAAEYQTLKLVIQIDKESLFTSAKVLKSLGFLEVMGKTLENAEDENNDTDKAEEQASKK